VYGPRTVSLLAYQGDDYPVASTKHLADAQTLAKNGRHLGCAYLAGYVVECALKSVLLYEASWDQAARRYDSQKLGKEQARLRQFAHNLKALRDEVIGVNVRATTRSQRYVPNLPRGAVIWDWSESLRYRAPTAIMPPHAQSMLQDATKVYQQTISLMARDQVLF